MKGERWDEVEGRVEGRKGNIMEARERKFMDAGWEKGRMK